MPIQQAKALSSRGKGAHARVKPANRPPKPLLLSLPLHGYESGLASSFEPTAKPMRLLKSNLTQSLIWVSKARTRAQDSSTPVPPAPMVTAEAAAEYSSCNPLHSTESNPGDDVVSYDVLESATEEHGIAPSASGPVHSDSASPDCLDDEMPGALVESTSEPTPVASRSGRAPDCDSGFERPRPQRMRTRAFARRVWRRFGGAISGC